MRVCLLAITIVIAAAGLAGCESSGSGGRTMDSVPRIAPAAASAAGLSERQLSDATALYVAKCAKCHQFYDPLQYSQPEWDTWLRKMSRKSRLKPDQEELLSRYLGAYRTGPH